MKLTRPEEEIDEFQKKRIEMIQQRNIEEYLSEIQINITFYTRGKKYDSVALRFASNEELNKRSTVPLRTAKWSPLPIYRVKCIIKEKIKQTWLIAAVLSGMKEESF